MSKLHNLAMGKTVYQARYKDKFVFVMKMAPHIPEKVKKKVNSVNFETLMGELIAVLTMGFLK